MAPIAIPASFKESHITIKVLERTKDSILIFSLLKTAPTTGAPRKRALKIVTNQPPHIDRTFITMLRSIQTQSNHPLVPILDFDTTSDYVRWYTMRFLNGLNIAHLLGNYYPNGFPPFLVFRVLDQISKAEEHLKERGLCYVNLEEGDNIMLHMRETAVVPTVTLVGYQGVKKYEESRDRAIFTYFMRLAKRMTNGEKRVPEFYRKMRGGEELPSGSSGNADELYEMIAGLSGRRESACRSSWRRTCGESRYVRWWGSCWMRGWRRNCRRG
jgi:serine/threonine protein kinase